MLIRRKRRAHQPSARQIRQNDDVTVQIEGRYAGEALQLLRTHGVTVCHWRTNMTGIAWLGHPSRAIEAPHPRSPISFSILAHEVGHHVLGRVRPRWREEQQAWLFAMDAMTQYGVPVNESVQQRYSDSMRYALAKALRRGLKQVPPELEPFLTAEERLRLM